MTLIEEILKEETKSMTDAGANEFTRDEVTRIIRRALEKKREDTVNLKRLLQTAAESGLDPETVVAATEEKKADLARKTALAKRDWRRR